MNPFFAAVLLICYVLLVQVAILAFYGLIFGTYNHRWWLKGLWLDRKKIRLPNPFKILHRKFTTEEF